MQSFKMFVEASFDISGSTSRKTGLSKPAAVSPTYPVSVTTPRTQPIRPAPSSKPVAQPSQQTTSIPPAASSTSTPPNQAGKNGKLSQNELKNVERNHYLRPDVADKFIKMKQDASAQNVNLDINNAYRDYNAQVQMAKKYGLYSKGGKAAVPGTSNHGWGTAVDLNVKANPGAFEWLKANAPKYGFRNIPREPWHWELA